ncbi:MAG: helix-turn-helix transcriptional regulator [Bacillota bacterium]|nr:helix-turn-helix transcriptional regulator [Bacillota bacterium]
MEFERIRSLRIDKDITQQQIAEYLNIKQNTYSQYEIGILNYPIDVLIKLSQYYNTSVDYLLGLTDEAKPYKRK